VDPLQVARETELQRDSRQFEGPITMQAAKVSRGFQPSTYFAQAQAIARALMADAELVGATFMPVSRDGTVDLALASKIDDCNYQSDCGANYYAFRSPQKSRQPGGVPSNVHTSRVCGVIVYLYAYYPYYPAEAVARYWTTTHCEDRVGPPPRCTLTQVWTAARARGAPADAAAQISWAPGTGWRFSTRLGPDAAGFEGSVPDDC
jgi:hypothetical protein